MEPIPVNCPRCGERQNQFASDSAPGHLSSKKVVCMACQYAFEGEEYRAGLEVARQEIRARLQQRSRL
jgi:rubredoxin